MATTYSYLDKELPLLLNIELNKSLATTIQVDEIFRTNQKTIFTIKGHIEDITTNKCTIKVSYQVHEYNPASGYSMSGGDDGSNVYLSFIFNFDASFREKLLGLQHRDFVFCKGRIVKFSKTAITEIQLDSIEKIQEEIINKSKEGCFIATACYGDYGSEEVLILRQFRDEKLLKTFLGKAFVQFYYSVSPFFTTVISKSDLLKKIVRQYLLEPIVTKLQRKNIR